MTPQDVADAILLLGPGFVMLKIVYLTGGQQQRLEWEWVVWSVLVSLVLVAIAIPLAGFTVDAVPTLSLDRSALEVVYRFALAVGLGLLGGWVWVRIRRSNQPRLAHIYRSVSDSAWDLVLDAAARSQDGRALYGVELTLPPDGVRYYGALSAFGRESASAGPWIYLTAVQRWDGDRYTPLPRTAGMLFPGDQVLRLRVVSQS